MENETINPTILDDTVTKKNPNTTIIKEESRLVGIEGITAINIIKITLPTRTKTSGISFSVLSFTIFEFGPVALRSLNESLKALMIVGKDFTKVTTPPKVTAPAPIYLI